MKNIKVEKNNKGKKPYIIIHTIRHKVIGKMPKRYDIQGNIKTKYVVKSKIKRIRVKSKKGVYYKFKVEARIDILVLPDQLQKIRSEELKAVGSKLYKPYTIVKIYLSGAYWMPGDSTPRTFLFSPTAWRRIGHLSLTYMLNMGLLKSDDGRPTGEAPYKFQIERINSQIKRAIKYDIKANSATYRTYDLATKRIFSQKSWKPLNLNLGTYKKNDKGRWFKV